MAKLTQSYAHGVSMTPLIGDTIGVHFDKVAERFAERDALIVRQQNIRWSYGELKAKVDAFAAGLLALGLDARRPRRHLVAEQCRMGDHAIRHRQGRAHPGQHQSGLSAAPSSNTRSTRSAARR